MHQTSPFKSHLPYPLADAARRTEMKKFGAAALDDKFLRNHVISRMDRQILINKKDQLQLLG